MRARIAATIVVAASLLLGTTGCSFFATQSTTKHYDPSDGVGASLGPIKVRNALLLSKDGQEASFLVNLINDGQTPESVLIQYSGTTITGESEKIDTRVQLGAGEVKTFGSASTRQFLFTGINSKPGSLFPVFVQYGTGTGKQLLVPVLDGSLNEYSTLMPSPPPTTTPAPKQSGLPEPTSSATPAPSPSPSK